jgi:hypothetical protein
MMVNFCSDVAVAVGIGGSDLDIRIMYNDKTRIINVRCDFAL